MSKEVKGCVASIGFIVAMGYGMMFEWDTDRKFIFFATLFWLGAEFVFMKAGDIKKLPNRLRVALGLVLCSIMHYLYSQAFLDRIPSYEYGELYIGYMKAFFVFIPIVFATLYFLLRAKKYVEPDLLAMYMGYFIVIGYNLFAIFGYSTATDSRFFAVPAIGISILLVAECMRAIRETTMSKGKGFEILSFVVYVVGNLMLIMS